MRVPVSTSGSLLTLLLKITLFLPVVTSLPISTLAVINRHHQHDCIAHAIPFEGTATCHTTPNSSAILSHDSASTERSLVPRQIVNGRQQTAWFWTWGPGSVDEKRALHAAPTTVGAQSGDSESASGSGKRDAREGKGESGEGMEKDTGIDGKAAETEKIGKTEKVKMKRQFWAPSVLALMGTVDYHCSRGVCKINDPLPSIYEVKTHDGGDGGYW